MNHIKFQQVMASCVFIVSIIISATHCCGFELTNEETAYLNSKGSIVFVSQTQYPPFEFIDGNGQHEGIMLDIIRRIAIEMGFKPIFKDMTFQQAQDAVLSGKADVLTSLFYSDKRAEKFKFTKPLFEVPASIFVKVERTDIKELKDLNGKMIAIQRGDYAKDFLESKKLHFFTLYTDNFLDATNMVISGYADAVIGDEQIVFFQIFTNRLTHAVKKVGEPLYIGNNCMASSYNNSLLIGILNKGINEATTSGNLKKIEKKWLGTIYLPKISFFESYWKQTAIAAGGGLLILLWIWVWNIRLRTRVREKMAAIIIREETLKQSEEKYRRLYETLIDVYYRIDNDGKIIMVSPSITQNTGYLPDELIGFESINFYAHPEHRETAMALIANDGFINNFVTQIKKKDGSFIWASFNAKVVTDNSGNRIGVEGIARNITDHKITEDLLRNEYAFRNVIIDKISEGLCVCHETKNYPFIEFTIWNERMTQITGYTMEEINHLGWYQTVYTTPELQNKARVRMQKMREGDDLRSEEWEITRADGKKRTLNISTTIIIKSEDGLVNVLSLMRDITESKKTQEALIKSESRYRLLAENATDVIWIIGMDLALIYTSPSIAKLLGFTVEEALLQTMSKVYTPESFDKAIRAFNEEMEIDNSGQCSTDRSQLLEMDLIHKNGSIVPVEGNFTFIRDPSGKATGILAIIREIAERKRADEALKSALKEKEILLREIHHRVKNNMQVVSSLISLQEGKMEKGPLKNVLIETQQRINTMSLIHETLYSTQNFSTLNFPVYIKQISDNLQRIYSDNIKTQVAIDLDIETIALNLDQAVPCGLIINELITNAFKHAFPDKPEGLIQVKAYLLNDKEIEMVVRDNGIGLNLDCDLENTSTLGLRLAQGLIKHQLKGSLNFTTGAGTTFTLRWPLPNIKGEII